MTLIARLARALAILTAAPDAGVAAVRTAGFHHAALAEHALPPAHRLPLGVDPVVIFAGVGEFDFAAEDEDAAFTQVSFGSRPLILEHGTEQALLRLASHARARGIPALFGPFEFDIERDNRRGRYSNRAGAQRPARSGSGAWRTLLISHDRDLAGLAWLAIAAGWDRLLGRLLGYPECCSDFFVRRWPEAWARHQGDLGSLLLAEHATPARALPWRANVFARYKAPCLVSHFPCSFDCAATLLLARRAEACLDTFRPDLAEAARGAMRGLVLEDGAGIHVLPGAKLRADGDGLVAVHGQSARGGPLEGVQVSALGLTRGGAPIDAQLAAFTADEMRGAAA